MSHESRNGGEKEDPRRKDIGFDQWIGNIPFGAIQRPKHDNTIFYTANDMREAWIAGHESALSESARIDQVSELLAVLNRDGGHHQEAVGRQEAAKDALAEVQRMRQLLAEHNLLDATPEAPLSETGRNEIIEECAKVAEDIYECGREAGRKVRALKNAAPQGKSSDVAVAEPDQGAARAPAAAASPLSASAATSGDAYFVVGYEDTPGFAIAHDKAGVRAALHEVIFGGQGADEGHTKDELDAHMEWFEDDDHWSIDRSHFTLRFEIGGLEIWRFPAALLASRSSTGLTEKQWDELEGLLVPTSGLHSETQVSKAYKLVRTMRKLAVSASEGRAKLADEVERLFPEGHKPRILFRCPGDPQVGAPSNLSFLMERVIKALRS